MKNNIILGLFSLAIMVSSVSAATIKTVLVTTNQLLIPYTGTYATSHKILLGTNSLPWSQAGKSANIIATLPTNILSGTYSLSVQGSSLVNVEIGSVNAEAALNARMDAETARAQSAEAGLTNGVNAEADRATAAEAGLSNSINAETTLATAAETDLANTINVTSNNIVANFTSNINAISNSVIAGVASNFNGVSNSIVASFNDRLNAASNSIVASVASNINTASNNIVGGLTKNFTAAFAFGYQVISNFTSIPFSSFIGDWTTNGTTFKIPATGIYQISFTINTSGASGGIYTPSIQIIDSNNSSTNALAYFSDYGSGGSTLPIGGQTTVQCLQGDLISVFNYGAVISYGFNQPTNIPSASLSIIQIQ